MVKRQEVESGEEIVLDVTSHVPFINPKDYNITDVEGVNPDDFFITSGDAVIKAGVLQRRLWEFAGEMRKKFGKSKNKKHTTFVRDIWSAGGKARAFVNYLTKVRGDAIFLEIERRDHVLYAIPKNPRGRED